MPELPEVETTRRGIAPHCEGRCIERMIVRETRFRWPVPKQLPKLMRGQTIIKVERRAKYLLLKTTGNTLLCHLGMSGSLRIVDGDCPPAAHDHIDIVLDTGRALRFHDPRRFGCMLPVKPDETHPLLVKLGPEPLSEDFTGDYLFQASRKRKTAVKTFLMDGHIVVGVGNIYANEALFAAGIRPDRPAGKIAKARYRRLAEAVKVILSHAISRGGTTLRDFVGGEGKPGYFSQELAVYGRGGQPCKQCRSALIELRLGQRATVYCRRCQR